jgi:molecular chaperone DnaK
MIEGFVAKAMNVAKDALAAANLQPSDIAEVLLVGGSTRIPLIQEEIKKYFGKEGNKSVNPDEAVALGAAIQGSILAGEQTGILLLDVTPLNLNITTMGGVATCMIEANTTIPTKHSQIFSTADDNQPAVDIEITQGARSFAKDNKYLGKFVLDGIAPARRGVPQIEVTFDIDANGILNVTAVDKATNKSQNIRIEGSSGLSKDEIAKMKDEAEAHAEEDKKQLEKISIFNTAEAAIYAHDKNMENIKEKMTEDELKEIDEALENLKSVYNVAEADRDADAISAATKNYYDIWYKVTERVNQETMANGPVQTSTTPVDEQPEKSE